MTVQEIVVKLHEYYEARDKHRALQLELAKIAVDCGQPQQDALKAAAQYLDGWLAGRGVLPQKRAA